MAVWEGKPIVDLLTTNMEDCGYNSDRKTTWEMK